MVHETNVYPDATQQSWDHDKYPHDIVSWILKAFIDNDVSAPPSEPALHDDSRVVVIAGRYVHMPFLSLETPKPITSNSTKPATQPPRP